MPTTSPASEPPAFPLLSTHHWVRIITANVQGTIRQVESSKTAGSLWKGEGRAVRVKSARSASTRHSPHLQDVTEPRMRYRMKVGREMMRQKIHDSCHKETSLSLPSHRPPGRCLHLQSKVPSWSHKSQLVKKQKHRTKNHPQVNCSQFPSLSNRLPRPAP